MRHLKPILLTMILFGLLLTCFNNAEAQRTVKYKNGIEQVYKILPNMPSAKLILKDAELKSYQLQKPITIPMSNENQGKLDNPLTNEENNILAEPSGYNLGSCWWDLQTNASMPRRVTTMPSGTTTYYAVGAIGSATGTLGKSHFLGSKTLQSLGTYIQMLEVNEGNENINPVFPTPWKKVEPFPAICGSVVAFSDNVIATASDRRMTGSQYGGYLMNGPIIIGTNPDLNENFVIDSSNATFAFFTRTAVDGQNNLHMIYNYRTTGHPEYNQLGYKKSANKGVSWTDEKILTGAHSFDQPIPSPLGYDVYAIDASGSYVLIVHIDRMLNVVYRRSSDYGQTWTPPTLAWKAEWDTIYTDLTQEPFKGWTDSSISPGACMDAIIDDAGNIHIAVNAIVTSLTGDITYDEENQRWVFIDSTLLIRDVGRYYPSIGFLHIYIPIEQGQQAKITACGPPGGNRVDLSLPSHPTLNLPWITRGVSDSCYGTLTVASPQLGIDEFGDIYLSYVTVRDSINLLRDKDTKTLYQSGNNQPWNLFFRHIFGQKMDINSFHWGNAFNLTPDGWDCSYNSMAKKIPFKSGEPRLPIVYVADQDPINWYNWTTIFQNLNSEPKLYFKDFKLKDFITGIKENTSDVPVNFEVYPNPITSTANVAFYVEKSGNTKLELFDVLGNKVMTIANENLENGSYNADFNASGIASGVYYLRLTNNGRTSTKIVNVEK